MQFKRPALNPTRRRLDAALTIGDLRRSPSGARPRPRSTTPTAPRRPRCPWPGRDRRSQDIEFHPAILRDVSTRRHRLEGAGRTGQAAVRHRPDRIHPDDADRRRARRSGRRGRRRDPVLAVHHGHRLHRGRRGRGNPTAATGSSCTCGRTGTARWPWSTGPPRPDTTRCSSPSTSPSPGPGCETSGTASPSRPQLTVGDRPRCAPPPSMVVQLPDHRALGLRLPRPMVRHRRRAARHHVRPDRHLRGSGLDQVPVARQARRQGGPEHSTTPAGSPTAGVDAHHPVQPRRTPARPGTRCRSSSSPTSSARSAKTPRSTWTPASCQAPTSSPPSPSAPVSPWSAAPTSTVSMAGGRAGVDRIIAILRSDIERTMRLLGATSLEELAPHHVTLLGY